MRNPEKIEEILIFLRKYWIKNPDLRLGQILHNLNSKHNPVGGVPPIWHLENKDLIDYLKEELSHGDL